MHPYIWPLQFAILAFRCDRCGRRWIRTSFYIHVAPIRLPFDLLYELRSHLITETEQHRMSSKIFRSLFPFISRLVRYTPVRQSDVVASSSIVQFVRFDGVSVGWSAHGLFEFQQFLMIK